MRHFRLAPLSAAFALFLSAQIRPLPAAAAPERTAPSSGSAAAPGSEPDEFASIPAGDPIYTLLKTTSQAGWTARAWNAGTEATRSEAALEVARIIFTVTARANADTAWTTTASKPAARALSELITTLRPELAALGVDTRAPLAVIDRVLKAKASPAPAPAETTPRPPLGGATLHNDGSTPLRLGGRPPTMVVLFSPPNGSTPARNPFAGTPLENLSSITGDLDGARLSLLPLSQRLRVTTAVQSLANEANDPFGRVPGDGSPLDARPISTLPNIHTGAELSVNPWLTLKAQYARQHLIRPAWGLSDGLLNGLNRQSEFGGGVDVAPMNGLQLSGGVSQIQTPTNPEQNKALKVGGGVRFSAWQNRLTLGANLSRLLPEDSQVFASTATQFDVNFGVTQSVTLNLLYQSLFRADSQTHPERFVGGGVSVSF